MKRYSILLFLFLATFAYADSSSWVQIDQGDGLTIYKKEVPGSPILAFKGEGVIHAPISRVAGVLFDNTRAPEWVDSLAESRILKQISPTSHIEYNHVTTPFIIKDRDFVNLVQIHLDPKTETLTLHYSPGPSGFMPQTKYVRGELTQSVFVLQSIDHGRKCHFVGEIHADPKGAIPKWIVNLFQRNWPRNTFNGLKAQLAKKDLKEPPCYIDLYKEMMDFNASNGAASSSN